MSELIDRQALMEEVRCRKNCDCANCDFYTDGDSWCDGEVYGTTIMQMPTVESKKGEWVDKSIYDAVYIIDGEIRVRQVIEAQCTSCTLYSTFDYGRFECDGNHFCPRCGADMRGEDE